jgi:hypothetical protein
MSSDTEQEVTHEATIHDGTEEHDESTVHDESEVTTPAPPKGKGKSAPATKVVSLN